MKRFLTTLFTVLLLTAALGVTASASSFDSAAEDLAAIGVFRGTSDGFALDKEPTRSQAAIMLVRLLGAETEALNTYRSGRVTCPFTDVNETTAPYVAWLADEGLANGTSATTFGGSARCTARAYTIFLLRALGYEDNVDFTTATAQDFAASLGIMDTSALTGTFLRDDLAALTYQALGTDLEDGSTYLLDSLIEADAVDANDARPIVEKIENLRALNAASASLGTGLTAGLDMNMGVTLSYKGVKGGQNAEQIEHTSFTGKGQISMLLDKNPQMAYDLTLEMDGETQEVQMWLKDGWMYMQTGEDSMKTELPETYQAMMTPGMTQSSVASLLPFLKSVTAKTSGGNTVYKAELNGALAKMLNTAVAWALTENDLPEGMVSKISIDGFSITYTVKDGALKSAAIDMAMSMNAKADVGEAARMEMGIGVTLEMTMDITASGADVKISYPDFSGFEEIA